MSQEDKLRNALRDYYDTQHTPFGENEWERTSAHLRRARNKRRLRYFAPLLAFLLSTGLVVTYLNFPGSNATEQKVYSSKADQKQKSSPVLQADVIRQEKEISLNKNTAPEQPVQTKTSTKNMPSEHSPVLREASENQEQEQIPAAENPEKHPPVIPGKTLASAEIKVTEKEQANTDPVPAKVELNTSPSASTPVSPASVPVESSTPNAAAPEVTVASAEKEEVKTVTENRILEQPVQEKEAGQETLNTPAQEAITLASTDDKKELRTEDTTRIPEKKTEQTVVANPVQVADTTPVAVKNDSLLALHELAGEGIFYEVGGAWLYGWNGAGKRDARGFSPVAGINYMNQLSRHCAFSFGIGYLRVGGLSNSSKTSRVSTYTYGEQSKVTVITPTTIHYLVAPLRLHYYLDQKTILGAGANLAYLLNIDATVTTYDEKPGVTENYSTIKQSGYTKGFSWFDSQLALFYRRNLTHSLAVQAEVFLGLTDVKQNEFFKLNATERNSGAKLSLVYYAFRKTNKQ